MQYEPINSEPIIDENEKSIAPSFQLDLKETSSSRDTNENTAVIHQWSHPEKLAVAFAENKKAQMAARAMFELIHQYGDNLREGWKNVLDCLVHLLRANLLPSQMIQIEDFVDPRTHISLKERFVRRITAPKKEESGLFSWLGFTSSSASGESDQNRPPTKEEKELCRIAANIITECHPEQLVPDSRYLASSALTELINNIIHCSISMVPIPTTQTQHHKHEHDQQHHHESQGSQSQDDDSIVDLSAAASALLPEKQKESTIAEQQESEPKVPKERDESIAAHTQTIDSNVSPASETSSVHVPQHIPVVSNEQHGHHVHGNFVQTPIKLSIDEEEALVFLLELMVNVVLENRDRLAQVWPLVREHLHWLFIQFPQNQQLMERAVVAIIRIANRNLFRLGQQHSPLLTNENVQPAAHVATKAMGADVVSKTKSVVIVVEDDQQQQPIDHLANQQTIQHRTSHCADEVLQFMGSQLLSLRPPELFLFSRQIAFGLQILLRANAANVHSTEHWEMFFVLLEAVGAAAYLDDDFDLIESNKQFSLQSSNRKAHQNNTGRTRLAVSSVQSDPEEMAASVKQQSVDDRGYCSDDPSREPSSQQVGKKRHENPLLVAAASHREQLQLLNKADSGEWIHVVPGPLTMTRPSLPTEVEAPTSPILPSHQPHLPTIPTQPFEQQSSAIPIETVACITSISPGGPTTVSPTPVIPVQTSQIVPASQPADPTIPTTIPPPIIPQSVPAAIPHVPPPPPPPHPRAGVFKRGTIVLAPNLSRHDPAAFLKVVEILTFLARDAAHITPANFSQFTHCLRMMVEASMDGGKCAPVQLPPNIPISMGTSFSAAPSSKQFPVPHEKQVPKTEKQASSEMGAAEREAGVEKMSEQERLANCYMDASLQLLNICYQLHARAADIYRDWSDNEAGNAAPQATAVCSAGRVELWSNYWLPLLQAMARMSCDCRRRIRAQSLDALAASFRVPALSELMQPVDWENCFAEVLFPLLARLLSGSPPISPMDPIGMEEARIRAIQLSCKILLSHLTQISRLQTFPDLLRRIFDLVDHFLESNACSDLLAEVIQESLKNCLLVCENFGIFHGILEGLQTEMNGRLEELAKKHGATTGLKMGL